MEKMKLEIPKEVFDFLKSCGCVATSEDDKTFMWLPNVYEIVSESDNLVIEHNSAEKLPKYVKDFVEECQIVKPKT